jgi:hypothetical protein
VLKVFIGFDERQNVAYSVARFSIERRVTHPTAIIPLRIEALPIERTGLTSFTWSRFLVPHLCGYEGWALFADSDFLFMCDVAEIFALADFQYAAMVVKNKERFEWASMILFNCAHPANRILTPEYIETAQALHGLQWLKPEEVGELPKEYNCLVGYSEPREAKVAHFTQGMPIFPETEGSPYKAEWLAEQRAMNSTKPWQETMGNSVHAAMTKDGRRVARLHKDAIQ